MKKAILFTLAALCISAAQAATVGWTAWSSSEGPQIASITGTSTYASICLDAIANTADAIDSTTFVTGALATGQTYYVSNLAFAIWSSGQWNDDNKTVGLKVYDANGNLLATSSTTEYQFNGGTDNKPFPNNGNKGFISFDFTDAFAATTTDTLTLEFIDTTTGDVYAIEDPQICGNGTSLTYRATVDTVPEPTALALLALGVAGLALKRKNA